MGDSSSSNIDKKVINDAIAFLYNNGTFGFAPIKKVISQLYPNLTDNEIIAHCQYLYINDWIEFQDYIKNVENRFISLINGDATNNLTLKAKRVLVEYGSFLAYERSILKKKKNYHIKRKVSNVAVIMTPIGALATIILSIYQVIDSKKVESIEKTQQSILNQLDTLKSDMQNISRRTDTSTLKKSSK